MNFSLTNKLIIIITIIISVLLSSASFVFDNSYWWDELYSITGSLQNINDMFTNFILNDVHPPLHLVVLKIWVYFFGSSEVSTRALSFMFSMSSLLLIIIWSTKNTSKHVAMSTIFFFSSSWLLIYYAQENRAYSMMLFFSTTITLLYIEIINKKFTEKKLYLLLFLSFILSLTHYFGFIFSELLLLLLFYQIKAIKHRIYIVFSGGLSIVWPFIHYTCGSLSSKTGGNFWIKSNGIQTTITVFINAFLPQSSELSNLGSNEYYGEFITMIFVVVMFLWLIYIFKKHSSKLISIEEYVILKKLSLYGVLFVTIISLVDLYSPISTTRNFIVLLPLLSIVYGLSVSSLKNRNKVFCFISILIVVSSFIFSTKTIRNKIYPLQNHKDTMNYIIKNKLYETHKIYYGFPEKSIFTNSMHKKFTSFYLPENINLYSVSTDKIDTLKPPFVYISQHRQNDYDSLIEFKKKGIDVDVFEPRQKWKMNSFLIYSK